jgi:UDP-glucose 4-epimerase
LSVERVLVTGSEGLLGKPLTKALVTVGYDVVRLDLRGEGPAYGDVRDRESLGQRMAACDGIVHLAAVSRVIWGEERPAECHETNVVACRDLLELARSRPSPPWVVFASSREVYGQPTRLPATEDTPLEPMNTYGRTKVEGERLVAAAGESGLRVSVVRLSNVFGRADDHADRVVPAFARAALANTALRVEGPDNSFDFVYVDDAVAGIMAIVGALPREARGLPPIHLVTGVPTKLADLAALTLRLCESRAPVVVAASRSFDVKKFHGDPGRARALLGWQAVTPLDVGLARLIERLRPRGGLASGDKVDG